MARNTNVNKDLEEALKPYRGAERVLAGVFTALGVPPGDPLSGTEYPVRGFFLKTTENLFSFYAVTPGRFVVFEMNLEGDSLTLTFPTSRIRRVVEETRKNVVTVTVEIDADRRTIAVEGEYLEQDTGNENNQRGGRFQGVQTESFAVYILSAEITDGDEVTEADQLLDLALALRNVVGE